MTALSSFLFHSDIFFVDDENLDIISAVSAKKYHLLITWNFDLGLLAIFLVILRKIRATSHTRRRARDHYTSSTLIGGKSEAGPSSLHTRLEGPMECISECKMDVPVTHDEKHVQNWLPQHSLRSRETVCGPLRTHEDKISK